MEEVLEPWPATTISNIGNIQKNWSPPAINNSRVRVRNRAGKSKMKRKLTKQPIQQFEAAAKKMLGMLWVNENQSVARDEK